MGVTGMDWCDFMAVCVKTREIMLKRIHFQPMYWKHVSSLLKAYSKVLKESRTRKANGLDPLDCELVKRLRSQPMKRGIFPGENSIVAEDLIRNERNMFYGASNFAMDFDFLMGYDSTCKCVG
ncbi:hypothetical protein ScPMuIL_017836 [Solemya velum]